MKFIILLALLLSACVPLFAPDSALVPDSHTEYNDAEAYYRGVYSFCMVLNAKALEGGADHFFDCNEMVKSAYRLKWHKRDAPGFEWPVEEEKLERLDDIVYVK